MNVNKNWKLIRLANEKYLKIPPAISDFIAVKDILRLCVSGLSNKTIANELDTTVDYVKDVLQHYMEFEGWEEDADFNPYFIYKKSNDNFIAFCQELRNISPVTDLLDIPLMMFRMSKIYDKIIEKITEFYEKESKNE